MKPSDETIDAAVLRLFRDDLAMRPGDRLALSTLRQDWLATHFRRSDLDDGLDRLRRRGLFTVERSEGEPCYALTETGAHAITDVPFKAGQWISRLAAALQQAGADRRAPTPPGTPFNRRHTDPPLGASVVRPNDDPGSGRSR